MKIDDESRTRVFISYSRKDLDVALALRDRLIEARFDAYLDVHDIVKGEPWQERLGGLIERSDTMVFLISPASVASEICSWEVNRAELQEKRILPVVVDQTPTQEIPARLQRLNFAFLDSPEKWANEFPLLISALQQDVVWTREHTRLGELALRWDAAGRPGRMLLRGADLDAAERWRDARPATAPQLSALHTELLSSSRVGAQRRMRGWIISMSMLAVCAIGLSSFAYWQRDLAIRNGEVAEQRAAALATDVALTRADQGAHNQALLMLLDASMRYADDAVPEKVLLGLREVTAGARNNRRFWFPARSRAFHLDGSVVVTDAQTNALIRIDPDTGTREQLARHDGHDIIAMASVGKDVVYVTREQRLFLVKSDADATNTPELLVALKNDGEAVIDQSNPRLHSIADKAVMGQRWVRLADGKTYLNEMWRYELATGNLRRARVPDNAGEWLGQDEDTAYFWARREQALSAISLDTGEFTELTTAQAIARGIAPCPSAVGQTSKAHLASIYQNLKPGLEQVRCAGLFGPLALMSQTRALVRSTMDEYFLFPAGAPVEVARETYWLEGATERLGSLGDMDPFAWFSGAPESALVAVAHADKIFILALRTDKYLRSSIYPDEDNVAREITAPDVTDGGRFQSPSVLTYSGADADRYQVTVTTLKREKHNDATDFVGKPVRAYWGSCGVQRSEQGARRYLDERAFAVTRTSPGRWEIQAGPRRLQVSADELKCATLSADGARLAVVDNRGVALFDTANADGAEPALINRIDDSSIGRVSFAGREQDILLTSHDYKVTAWRADGAGGYTADNALRSPDFVMFAEGAPDGERMLVWYEIVGASALTEVLPIKPNGMKWLSDGPYMLVGNPDVFFAPDGSVLRYDRDYMSRLMAPIKLEQLRAEALAALSPSCLPPAPGDYRASACWPRNF